MAKKARFSEVVVDRLVVRDPAAPSNKTFVIEGGHKDRGEKSAKLKIQTQDGESYESLVSLAGLNGTNGQDGASAYDIWLANGNEGDEMAFLTSLIGLPGLNGIDGQDGEDGQPGQDGEDGQQGIQGIQGIPGIQGPPGETGPQGIQGLTGETGAQGAQGIQGFAGIDGKTVGVYLDRETVHRDSNGNLAGNTSDILLHFTSSGYLNPEYRLIEEYWDDVNSQTAFNVLENFGFASSPYSISSSDFPDANETVAYVITARESADSSGPVTQKKSLACVQQGDKGEDGEAAHNVSLEAPTTQWVYDSDDNLLAAASQPTSPMTVTATAYNYTNPEYRWRVRDNTGTLGNYTAWSGNNTYSVSDTDVGGDKSIAITVETRENGTTDATARNGISIVGLVKAQDGSNGKDGYSLTGWFSPGTILRDSDGNLANPSLSISLLWRASGFTNPEFQILKLNSGGAPSVVQTYTTFGNYFQNISSQYWPTGDSTEQFLIEVREGNSGGSVFSTYVTLTSIQKGADGEDGDTGPQGPQGPAGTNGTNGTNGTSVISNNFDMTLGEVGWSTDGGLADGVASTSHFSVNYPATNITSVFGGAEGVFDNSDLRRFYTCKAIAAFPNGDLGGTFKIRWRGKTNSTGQWRIGIRCFDSAGTATDYWLDEKEGETLVNAGVGERAIECSVTSTSSVISTGGSDIFTAWAEFTASDLNSGTVAFKPFFYRSHSATTTTYVDFFGVTYAPTNNPTSNHMNYPDGLSSGGGSFIAT